MLKHKRLIVLLVVVFFSFVLWGCSASWEKYVQVSDLYIEETDYYNYVKGEIKNLTDKYYDVTITIDIKNGSISDTLYAYEKVKPKEIAKFSTLTKYDSKYKMTVKDIQLSEMEIPELIEEGEVTVEALEYYFPEILNNHELFMTSVSMDFNNKLNGLHYVDTIERKDGIIDIHYKTPNVVAVETKWDEKNNKIQSASLAWLKDYKPTSSYFMFPLSGVFDYDASFGSKIISAIYEPDGVVYENSKWGFMARIDGNVEVFVVMRK